MGVQPTRADFILTLNYDYYFKAAEHFEEKFSIKATELSIEELQYALDIWMAKCTEAGSPGLETEMAYGKDSICVWWELLKSIFRLSDHTFPILFFCVINRTGKDKQYQNFLEQFAALAKKFEDIFHEDAIFLFPAHPEPPPHFITTIPKLRNLGHTAIFNMLGFPSTAVPAGLSDGLPISVQVISGPFKDRLTIAAAQELDKVFGGWKSPCAIQI